VARGKLFPHYLAPVLSTCIVHRDDVPSLLETLNSHVLDPRINAFDEALADARAEGVIKEDIHGYQVDALVTGLLLAQYRGLPEMNTANKDATVMADTIWTFISTLTHTPTTSVSPLFPFPFSLCFFTCGSAVRGRTHLFFLVCIRVVSCPWPIMNYCSDMRTRTPMRVLLVAALMLALLPTLSTFAPGGQVAGFTTASPAVADQILVPVRWARERHSAL